MLYLYYINKFIFSIRTCSDAIQNLQSNAGSQAQTTNLRHKCETLLNQVKDFDTILMNISDTSETVIIITVYFNLKYIFLTSLHKY